MSLRRKAFNGMIWSYTQQFASQLIGFAVSVILARLLLPKDFGLVGMLAIFIAVGELLVNGGLSASLIRSDRLTREDYSAVFLFNIGMSLMLYLVLFCLAPIVAWFYKQPVLEPLLRVYGLCFVITGAGAVHQTLLVRQLKFKKLLFTNLPAYIFGCIVGVTAALSGEGVWSLVWMYLTNAVFTTLLLWIQVGWIFKWRFNKTKFNKHFSYGRKLTLSGLLEVAFTNIYQVIIGKYYSPALVGYYVRANTLMMLPVGNISTALNKVMFPLFSKVQHDQERLKKAYKQVMLSVLFLTIPLIVLMMLLAHPLVLFLFTEKWSPMIPVFQVVCLTGLLYPVHSYNLIVLQVKGRSDLFLKLEWQKKMLAAIVLCISLLGGFYALLWGQVFFSVVALVINTHYAGRFLKYPLGAQLKDICPIFIFALLMGCIVFFINSCLSDFSEFSQLIVGGTTGIIVYFLLAALFRYQGLNILKSLLKFKQ